MQHLGWASVPSVNQYIELAESLALDTDAALAHAGIERSWLELESTRIPGEAFQALIQDLAEQSQDPLLGLKAARYVRPGSYSVLGYIAMNCKTLAEAVGKIPAYEKLVGDMGITGIQMDGATALITWQCAYTQPLVRRHMITNVLGSWMRYGQWLLGSDVYPEKIYLEFGLDDPAWLQAYQHDFNCPVLCNQPFSAVAVGLPLFQLPIRQPNNTIRETLEQHANQQMAQLAEPSLALATQIKNMISDMLHQGLPRKEQLAEQLGMTPRTLQRRLQTEGVTFQQLLDDVRSELARSFLAESNLSIQAIAERLGFSEPRSFHRSFKTWTGQTPAAYREQHTSP